MLVNYVVPGNIDFLGGGNIENGRERGAAKNEEENI